MTPKEKAIKLVDEFDDERDLYYYDSDEEHNFIAAKQFAIIAVNQILEHIEVDRSPIRFVKCYTKEWWEQVLKEIEMYQYS